MKRSLFTPDQVIAFRDNPYTFNVTEGTVRFSLAFKQIFCERYDLGHPAQQIFRDLGYDVSALGKNRIYAFTRHIKVERASDSGLHEGNRRPSLQSDLPDYTGMSKDEALARMQYELLYMRSGA